MALTKCKACDKEISKNAKKCPHCGEPTPKKTSSLTWIVAILFVLFFVSMCSQESKSPAQRAQEDCTNGILSYYYAEVFIKKNLKSPTSAIFPSYSDVQHTYLGECKHTFSGTVNAQNAFGAMIANTFNVTIRYDKSTQTYYLEHISLE
ncbi:MAG: hypothetical protein COA92_07980 [Sulfurovum sp.]|nr:MAG: hypothetical protein COA92_07980 [Sulfurovum sp.]